MNELDEPIKICPDVQQKDLRQLAVMVVLQAVEDAQKAKKIERKLDAVLFLTGEDIGWWCEWAGMAFADVWKILTDGTARTARTGRRNGNNGKRRFETV